MSSLKTFPSERPNQKQLGQYFTGPNLASLLAHLARSRSARSAIDPMAGSGDMLRAVDSLGGGATNLQGIEVDPTAIALARNAGLPEQADLRLGDAFAPGTWTGLPCSWDLVITNPPYVRYQRLGGKGSAASGLAPSALAIRTGLTEIVAANPDRTNDERACFAALASGYSGLSDLAVPSWILAASLVSEGGRLALVVPDTWMSRNYAGPALYVLSRFFEIEVIVEDGDACWFTDALVRTTLLVARRVPDRGTAHGGLDRSHVRARLRRRHAGPRSVVENVYDQSADPDGAFTRDVLDVLSHTALSGSDECQLRLDDGASLVRTLEGHQASRWFKDAEAITSLAAHRNQLPTSQAVSPTLADYGWDVGQGMRTGANTFFYVDVVDERSNEAVVRTQSGDLLRVPCDLLLPVVRRQSECRGKYECGSPVGRLLVLDSVALPEDMDSLRGVGVLTPYVELPEPLASYVRASAEANIGSVESPKRIPELSAVATNVRRFDRHRPERIPRFWYQLPALAERHRPALFVPRVNNGVARAIANPGRVSVVDANFSTLWPLDDAMPVDAVLALLNSGALRLALEQTATVLGGGALKVEATLLRRLPMPRLNDEAVAELAVLGQGLRRHANQEEVMSQIDDVVFAALGQSLAGQRETLNSVVKRRSTRRRDSV